jgi:dimethylamine/trimethylamine dehydrogenase
VRLIEARDELGGYARLLSQLPGADHWLSVVTDRERQLRRLPNVEIAAGTCWGLDEIRESGAEVVVAATGARWSRDGINHVTHSPIPGSNDEHVRTPEQVLRGEAEVGDRVLVYDCEGYLMGAGIAELLAAAGARVTLATPFETVAPVTVTTLEAGFIRTRLHQLGVVAHTETRLAAIELRACRLVDPRRGEEALEVSDVILVTARLSEQTLYRAALRERETGTLDPDLAVYAVGDCVAPRMTADVVFEGHRLAREIDEANPEIPLPFAREDRDAARDSLAAAAPARF